MNYEECKKFMQEHPDKYIWWEDDCFGLVMTMQDKEAMAEKRRRYQQYPEAREALEFDLQWWLHEIRTIPGAKDIVIDFYNQCKNSVTNLCSVARETKRKEEEE